MVQDLRYFVPLPAGAVEKRKESSVPGKLELLKVLTAAPVCAGSSCIQLHTVCTYSFTFIFNLRWSDPGMAVFVQLCCLG